MWEDLSEALTLSTIPGQHNLGLEVWRCDCPFFALPIFVISEKSHHGKRTETFHWDAQILFLVLVSRGPDCHLVNKVGLCRGLFSCIPGTKAVSPDPNHIYGLMLPRIRYLFFAAFRLWKTFFTSRLLFPYSKENIWLKIFRDGNWVKPIAMSLSSKEPMKQKILWNLTLGKPIHNLDGREREKQTDQNKAR